MRPACIPLWWTPGTAYFWCRFGGCLALSNFATVLLLIRRGLYRSASTALFRIYRSTPTTTLLLLPLRSALLQTYRSGPTAAPHLSNSSASIVLHLSDSSAPAAALLVLPLHQTALLLPLHTYYRSEPTATPHRPPLCSSSTKQLCSYRSEPTTDPRLLPLRIYCCSASTTPSLTGVRPLGIGLLVEESAWLVLACLVSVCMLGEA